MPPSPLNFHMPGEWEPHAATWIAWPHNRADWPGKFGPIPWVYTEIVRQISRGERVCILVNDERLETRARRMLRRAGVDLGRVAFHRIATDRVWVRDFGPIFVTCGDAPRRVAITAWGFNAWARYPDWQRDAAVPEQVARALDMRIDRPAVDGAGQSRRVVLEGGSIDVNGRGTLLTTEECLLSPIQERNPGLARADLERLFAEYLGVRTVVWLDRGIAGDDTHGHVDDLARFVAPDTVVAVVEDDPASPNFEPLRDNLERLRRAVDQDGRPLRVVSLPMPEPVVFAGRVLPASYANFYIANAAVLVPTFNDPYDPIALMALQGLFPDRPVVGVGCRDLVWGLGTLHCTTQQQPAGMAVPAERHGPYPEPWGPA